MIINCNEKLLLRPITFEDTNDIIRWRNKDSVRKKFLDQRPFTVEGHTKWMNEVIKTGKAVQFIICIKENGIVRGVGTVFLRDINRKDMKAEYGIFIGEESALGKGVGTDCARAITQYGFSQLKLHKIFLRVLADNEGAIKSYQKAGFMQEAYLKDEVFINGDFKDIILMARINPKGGLE